MESLDVIEHAGGGVTGNVPLWLVLHPEASNRAVHLYALLDCYAVDGEVFITRQVIAHQLRCSVDSLDRAVRDLVEVGALTVTRRTGKDGGPVASVYSLEKYPSPLAQA